jgi:hypothetical protein
VNRVDHIQVSHRDVQRELGNRADAIHRQPWRIWRNRRLRAEVRAIMAVVDPEWKPDQQPQD